MFQSYVDEEGCNKTTNDVISPDSNWASSLYQENMFKIEDDRVNCSSFRDPNEKTDELKSGDNIDDVEVFKLDRSRCVRSLVFNDEIVIEGQRDDVAQKIRFPLPRGTCRKIVEQRGVESKESIVETTCRTGSFRYLATVNRG